MDWTFYFMEEFCFSRDMHRDLVGRISSVVRNMNYDRGFADLIRRMGYDVGTKNYDMFVAHRESMEVIAESSFGWGSKKSSVAASIYVNESRDGLDGKIVSHKKGDKIADMIHKFSHKYGISTGELLCNFDR